MVAKTLSTVILLFITLISVGQDLIFDLNGKLLTTPPNSIKIGDKWNLKINVPATRVDDDKKEISSRVDYLDNLLNSQTKEEINLKKEYWKINRTLKKAQSNSCSPICLPNDSEFLASIPEDTSKDTFNRTCFNDTCLCALAATRLKIISQLYDFFQRRKLIAKIFCDKSPEEIKLLFKLNDSTGSKQYRQFIQKARFLPDTVPTGSSFYNNDVEFEWKVTDKKSLKVASQYIVEDPINIEIRKENRFNKMLLKWHNETVDLLDREYVQKLQRDLANDRFPKEINVSALSPCISCTTARIDALNRLLGILKKYDTVWCPTSPVVTWLKNWIWYSKGDFKLNYLPFTSPSSLATLADKLEISKVVENNYTELISRIDSLKNCLSCKTTDYKKYLDTLKALQDSAAIFTGRKKMLTIGISLIKDTIDNNTTRYEEFVNSNRLIHTINLPVQSSKNPESIIYYDVSNKWKGRFAKSDLLFPDNYTIYYGLYNATPKDTSLQIEEINEPFNDTAKFTTQLLEISSALGANVFSSVSSSFVALLSNVFGTTSSTRTEPHHGGPAPEIVSEPAISVVAEKNTCSETLNEIYYRLWRYDLMRKMIEDYNRSPLPDELKSSTNNNSVYLTYAVKARDFKAPYTNRYRINNRPNGKTLASGTYNMGRQATFSIGAGIFFNTKAARQELADTANGNLSIKNIDDAAKFVIGVKLYPFKSFDAENSMIPKYPLKRLSLFSGFEVVNPLRNLYFGAGWDLVPGLHVSAGIHLFRKDYYKIQNNSIVGKTTSYKASGLYYGVTIDPIALLGILKFLFIK